MYVARRLWQLMGQVIWKATAMFRLAKLMFRLSSLCSSSIVELHFSFPSLRQSDSRWKKMLGVGLEAFALRFHKFDYQLPPQNFGS
jgi:hypothetical protein